MTIGTTLANLGSNALNLAQITEVAQYFDAVRIFADITNAAQVTLQRQQAIYAKQAGLRVIYGSSAPSIGNNGFSSTFYTNTYRPAVLLDAAFCAANNIDEHCIANEEELRLDETSIVDPYSLYLLYLKPLASDVHAIFTGDISFCISNGAEPWIINITPGAFTKAGFNSYGDFVGTRSSHNTFVTRVTNFKNYVNWGSIAYISEFNVDYNGARFQTIAANDERLTMEMALKLKVLIDLGYQDIYPFCWKYSGGNDDFSMKKNDGSYRGFMQVMSNQNKRRFMVNL